MCSNTSSSGAGVSGSIGDDGNYASLILKKHKRQRVPKRGPGVAELEKILREQENKNNTDQGKIEQFSSSCSISKLSNSYHRLQSWVISSSYSLTGNVSFVPDHNYFSPPSPPMNMLYGHCGKNTLSGGAHGVSKGGHIGGSAMALPEQALLPTTWSSCESSIYDEGPKISAGYPFFTNFPNRSDQMHHSAFILPKKHGQYTSPTRNLFPHSGSLSSPDKPSAGFYVHLEPPSNQRLHHNYTSVLPEEDKIVSTKRPRTFSVDNTSASFHCQISPPFPNVPMFDQLPSCANHTAFSLKGNESVSRDHPKPGGPLELNTKKSITDYGPLNGNFLIFGSPATLSPVTQTSQQEFSKYHPMPFQESMEGSHRMSEHSGSVQKKPFYIFLKSEEKMGETETTLSLNNERGEARGEAIDLSLRL